MWASSKRFDKICQCWRCQQHARDGRPRLKRCGYSRYDRWYVPVIDEQKTWEEKCDFCKGEDYIAAITFPLITEFLKVTWLCWQCQDLVNRFVLFKHKLCLMESPSTQIELALLDMLEYCLRGEILIAQGVRYGTTNEWVKIRLLDLPPPTKQVTQWEMENAWINEP